MFLDASVILAIAGFESDCVPFAYKVASAKRVLVSPIVIYEATTGLARLLKSTIFEANSTVSLFLHSSRAATVIIDQTIGNLALEAFDRYGKGRHQAGLNMGDCFAYACAKAHKAPLLFKGRDFSLTDIAVA